MRLLLADWSLCPCVAVPQRPCLEKVSVQDVYSVKDMAQRWHSFKASNPALLVRVLMKSRILHYAKPHKNDKWPFLVGIAIYVTSSGKPQPMEGQKNRLLSDTSRSVLCLIRAWTLFTYERVQKTLFMLSAQFKNNL